MQIQGLRFFFFFIDGATSAFYLSRKTHRCGLEQGASKFLFEVLQQGKKTCPVKCEAKLNVSAGLGVCNMMDSN